MSTSKRTSFEVLRIEFKKSKKANIALKSNVNVERSADSGAPSKSLKGTSGNGRILDADMVSERKRNSLHIIKGSSGVLLALHYNCTSVALKGAGEMILLHGAVQIMGFSAFKINKAYKVYSPSTESLLTVSLQSSSSKSNSSASSLQLDNQDWTVSDEETITRWIQEFANCAIILFKESISGLGGIEAMMPVFKSILSSSTSQDSLLPSLAIVNHSSNPADHAFPEMHIPDSYLASLKGLGSGGSVHCIVGAKNSGKSTLARHLTNNILSRRGQVAYLDCDVGQPEFTPCGLVSLSIISDPLLGPPFTHLRMPEYARFTGATSAKQDPDQYISLLLELVHIYQSKYQHLDLVVNTSGWIRGVGFDLLCHFLSTLSPTNVIVLQEDVRSGLIESLEQVIKTEKKANIVPQLSVPEIQVSRLKLNAADQRNLTMISYFMQVSATNPPPVSQQGHLWNFTRPFTHQIPFSVPLTLVSLKFLNSQVPFSQTFYALNGSIVGLVIDGTLYHHHSKESTFCKLVPTHTPLYQTNCLGLGLVRSINLSTQTLHILTPVPLAHLARVDLLVRGSSGLECPVSLLTHVEGKKRESVGVPYTTRLSAEGVGASEIKSRHLGRRRGQ